MRFPSPWRGDQRRAAGRLGRYLGHDLRHRTHESASRRRAPQWVTSRLPAFCFVFAGAILLAACGKQSGNGADNPYAGPGAASPMRVGVLTINRKPSQSSMNCPVVSPRRKSPMFVPRSMALF